MEGEMGPQGLDGCNGRQKSLVTLPYHSN